MMWFVISLLNFDPAMQWQNALYFSVIYLTITFAAASVIVLIVFPLVFMNSIYLQSNLIFFGAGGLSRKREDFESSGETTPGMRNFYVEVNDEETGVAIRLGIWHLLPWSLVDDSFTELNFDYDQALSASGHNVFVHFHSNGQTRKDSVELFNMLRMFCHVIALDYRGYGDSSTEFKSWHAIVNDCKQLYNWVASKTRADIYFWGHALGASLAINTAALVEKEGRVGVNVVILDASFTTLEEALAFHPYAKMLLWLPWGWLKLMMPLRNRGFDFDNVRDIDNVDCPILILHAVDDSVIPCKLGEKLAQAASGQRRASQGTVTFRKIAASYGCDHSRICRYRDLPYDVRSFLIRNRAGANGYILQHGQGMILKHWVLKRKYNWGIS